MEKDSFVFIIIPISCKTASHISNPKEFITLKAKITNADNVFKRCVNLEKREFSWYNHNVKKCLELNSSRNTNIGFNSLYYST
jgi:hypothetical protein